MKDNTLKRIEWAVKNKVNHISPTISPAKKDSLDIESLQEGVNYYLNKGIECYIQEKFMGSYSDLYLFPNFEDCYCVSRNGYIIKVEVKDALYKIWEQINWDNLEYVILQAELLPLRVFGEGLVQEEFIDYYETHKTNYDQLQDFLDFPEVKDSDNEGLKRQFNAFLNFAILLCKSYITKEALSIYKRQLDLYCKEGEPEFKPFGILKYKMKDNKEVIVDDNYNNPFSYLMPVRKVIKSEGEIDDAYEFYNEIVENGAEGVVIKPLVYQEGICNLIKVRNPEYLNLIYGINFHINYDEYHNRRDIKNKFKISVNDQALSRELLKIPYHELNDDNYQYKIALFKKMEQEKAYINLDKNL